MKSINEELYILEEEYKLFDKHYKEATERNDSIWIENLAYKKEYLDNKLIKLKEIWMKRK